MLAAPCSMLIMAVFTDALILARAGMVIMRCSGALGHCVSYLSVVCLNHSTEKSIKPSMRGLVRRSGVQILFHPCSKIGIAADMLLIDKKSAARFLRVYLAFCCRSSLVIPSARILHTDTGNHRVHCSISQPDLCTHTVRATRTTKITVCIISLLIDLCL